MVEVVTPLWAMHISDGVLSFPWLAGGFVLAGLLAAAAAYRIRDEEIPRVALLSAAFFVVSLMHVRLGPTSVHLLLVGLVGVILGRRAPLALLVALGMQAILLQHGGFTTIGVNTCVVTMPALLCAALFQLASRPAWARRRPMPFAIGFLIGSLGVLSAAGLNALVLLWGGVADWHSIVVLVLLAHLPLAPLEGVVAGFTVSFLARVKPELLPGWEESPGRLPLAVEPVLRLEPGHARQAIQPAHSSLTTARPPVLLLAVGIGLLWAAPAQAHRLVAEHHLLPGKKVQIESWFDLGGDSPHGASVQVYRSSGALLCEGKLDERGTYIFDYDQPQALRVVVSAGAGHVCEDTISAAELGGEAAAAPVRDRSRALPWREVVSGVSAILALAAFLMSWRNGRQLRQLMAQQERHPRAELPTVPGRD